MKQISIDFEGKERVKEKKANDIMLENIREFVLNVVNRNKDGKGCRSTDIENQCIRYLYCALSSCSSEGNDPNKDVLTPYALMKHLKLVDSSRFEQAKVDRESVFKGEVLSQL